MLCCLLGAFLRGFFGVDTDALVVVIIGIAWVGFTLGIIVQDVEL